MKSPDLPSLTWHSRLKKFGMVLMLTVVLAPVAVASVNTAQIVASAASVSCISWRVKGLCYWLLCSPWGCKVRTSIKVEHFIPQAVVSVYNAPGGNPWREMSQVSQAVGEVENMVTGALSGIVMGGGNHQLKIPGNRKNNLHFKYADAIGHPATAMMGGKISGYACKSAATPFMPYFLSTLDSLVWRTGMPESFYPEALIPGKRELGYSFRGNMWGNIYPRSGFVTQQDDNKAAAVVAQRVADIITRTGQGHVYQSLQGNRKQGYWPPGEAVENTGSQNHQWQRIAPKMSASCAVFPDNSGEAAKDGNYVFALWQPYSCCQRRGQTFLYSTDF